jgi:arginine/ornithine N-succinyltransferase beta subunit
MQANARHLQQGAGESDSCKKPLWKDLQHRFHCLEHESALRQTCLPQERQMPEICGQPIFGEPS